MQSVLPLVDDCEIKVGFGVLRTKCYSGFEGGGSVFKLVSIEVGKSEIQKEVPGFEPEAERGTVLADLFGSASHHAVGKTQVIMRDRVVSFRLKKSPM